MPIEEKIVEDPSRAPGAAKVEHWTRAEATHLLIGNAGLYANRVGGAQATQAVLSERRCVQLDPLDRIGTNADLVMMARTDGMQRGGVFDHLYPGHAFEHFAKERCFLPADAFPAYRDQAARTPNWRSTARQKRIPQAVLDDVLAEVTARGPVGAADLADRGRVDPINWSGWKGTSKAATMALDLLWLRCQVVTTARRGRRRIFDIPSRALPAVHDQPGPADFSRWATLERIAAIGLMPRIDGPWWSMLGAVRRTLPDQLIEEGALVEVRIKGVKRPYLALPDQRARTFKADDGRMRILGPLDPLLWCRPLLKDVFDFAYIWEVYKPAAQRKYGYYVCPLLHHGRLVGRFEGRAGDDGIELLGCWPQPGEVFDKGAFKAAIARHALGMTKA
ncbi:MAG: hypothetical protein ACI9U2_004315 [Bradymonadia bacterium]